MRTYLCIEVSYDREISSTIYIQHLVMVPLGDEYQEQTFPLITITVGDEIKLRLKGEGPDSHIRIV